MVIYTDYLNKNSKCNVIVLKHHLCSGDLVYKFKRIVGKPYFCDQFKKIINRYIKVGYNLDVMPQSACLVLNSITIYSYVFYFSLHDDGSGLRRYYASDVKL